MLFPVLETVLELQTTESTALSQQVRELWNTRVQIIQTLWQNVDYLHQNQMNLKAAL